MALKPSDAHEQLAYGVAALLASYFDIVFALNRVLHPGEKRLIAFAHSECTLLPTAMDADIAAVLAAAGMASAEVVVHLTRLLDVWTNCSSEPALMRTPGTVKVRNTTNSGFKSLV
jgi:hypothetical protein